MNDVLGRLSRVLAADGAPAKDEARRRHCFRSSLVGLVDLAGDGFVRLAEGGAVYRLFTCGVRAV